jgi:hypothetical protein
MALNCFVGDVINLFTWNVINQESTIWDETGVKGSTNGDQTNS